MTRTGQDYIESLRDGRTVWFNGERVKDITTHKAFRNTVRSIAGLYDLTHEPSLRDVLTVEDPALGGARIHRAYHQPTDQAGLVARREAYRVFSRASYGFLGRSPDYMASAVAGFAAVPEVFHGAFDARSRLDDHYRRMAVGDLFQSHTIVNPQIDRTKPASEQEEDDLYVRVVEERDGGIVVRGAKMIGTGAVFGDEMLVGTIEPLGPKDAPYAVSFSVPVNTPGITLISRKSYEGAARSVFDNPLASRFDENDALLVCDNVFVPWERVLVYQDVDICYRQWWDTPAFANLVHHGAARFWTKLEFLTGIGILIAKANNTYGLPPVRAQIGRLMGWLNTAKAFVVAMEAGYETTATGVAYPNEEMIHAHRFVAADLYPKVLAEIKLLAGGGLIQLPSSVGDLLNPELSPLLRKYVRSPGTPSEARIKLFKLAWDALGSEFAGRHDQYERFYHGASYVYLPAVVRRGHPEVCERLAQACLDGYGLEDPSDLAAAGPEL
jgi:4-hydroxyphenylacetate 3-monooxygenase